MLAKKCDELSDHSQMPQKQQQMQAQHQNANKQQLQTRKQLKRNQKQQQKSMESSSDCDDNNDDDDDDTCCCYSGTEEESCTSANPMDFPQAERRRNLEFAQKLGYSDELIQTAFQRLGAEAKQNELLAELIKLSADAPKVMLPTSSTQSNSNDCTFTNGHSANSATQQLRQIVIDGSNVALSHGNNEVYSCRGIRICVDWFRQRGHKDITAFVPQWRKESLRPAGAKYNIIHQEVLSELERERVLVFTPSRQLDGKRVACYDDRYILKLAAETDGIVVSNDNYRDLALENAEFRKVVQERLLMYSFVNDRFMPPDDPLGRAGPTLDVFLRRSNYKSNDIGNNNAQQLCPYGKKCTYGQKCKFRHQNTQQQQTQQQQQQHWPLTASFSAPPLNFGSNINNNAASNKLNTTAATPTTITQREPLCRAQSNTTEKHSISQNTYNANTHIWSTSQQLDEQLSAAFQYQLDGQLSSPLNNNDEMHINRHKKLQRQRPQLNGYEQLTQTLPHHRPLAPTISAPPVPPTHSTHTHLTRIISAPVGSNQLHSLTMSNNAQQVFGNTNGSYMNASFPGIYGFSASDSRINAEHFQTTAQTREEKRRLLRFHLINLFPQHQVHAVMQMYPEETNAKALCAAIINLFPHN